MKNIQYSFAKNPREGTAFTVIRTARSTDGERDLLLELSKDSKSDKFKDIKQHDLLLHEKDLSAKNMDNMLVVESVGEKIKVRGYSVNVYGMDEFQDGDQLYFLGRAEIID